MHMSRALFLPHTSSHQVSARPGYALQKKRPVKQRLMQQCRLPSRPQFRLYQTLFRFKRFIVGVNHPCIAPSHLQSLPYCITIARPLRKVLLPTPLLYAI